MYVHVKGSTDIALRYEYLKRNCPYGVCRDWLICVDIPAMINFNIFICKTLKKLEEEGLVERR